MSFDQDEFTLLIGLAVIKVLSFNEMKPRFWVKIDKKTIFVLIYFSVWIIKPGRK